MYKNFWFLDLSLYDFVILALILYLPSYLHTYIHISMKNWETRSSLYIIPIELLRTIEQYSDNIILFEDRNISKCV